VAEDPIDGNPQVVRRDRVAGLVGDGDGVGLVVVPEIELDRVRTGPAAPKRAGPTAAAMASPTRATTPTAAAASDLPPAVRSPDHALGFERTDTVEPPGRSVQDTPAASTGHTGYRPPQGLVASGEQVLVGVGPHPQLADARQPGPV
jgi:hypothetical protein